MKPTGKLVALLLPLLLPVIVACHVAEQPPAPAQPWTDPGFLAQGAWVLRYSAVLTTDLDPAIARSYAVEVKQNRAIVSVTLQRAIDGADVPAEITAVARTLLGTPKPLTLRPLSSTNGGTWIGTFSVENRETVVFEISARARDSSESIAARWQRSFYLE